MNSSRPAFSETPYYTMERVIDYLKRGLIADAETEFQGLTVCYVTTAQKAVEALRLYLDPSHPEYPKASVQAPEAIPEPSQEKPAISKWIVTGISPESKRWYNDYDDLLQAEEGALIICNEGYKDVSISQVIAEARYSISL